MLSSLLDEVGPAIIPQVTARSDFELLSVGAVVLPTAAMLSEFVLFGGRRWQRAEGSGDVPGAEWYPRSRDEIDDPTQRAANIRQWITRILRDSGFVRGYERDIDLLRPPRLQRWASPEEPGVYRR